jgi:hypothetical protein
MKRCKGCQETLPPEAFYAKKGARDGLESKCKDCKRSGVAKNRKRNKAHYAAYDKIRNQSLERMEASQRYAQSDKGKISRQNSLDRYARNHPERVKAQELAGIAMAQGKIQRPIACESCGQRKPLQAHHHDYSKPYDVTFLCTGCHRIADNRRRKTE